VGGAGAEAELIAVDPGASDIWVVRDGVAGEEGLRNVEASTPSADSTDTEQFLGFRGRHVPVLVGCVHRGDSQPRA